MTKIASSIVIKLEENNLYKEKLTAKEIAEIMKSPLHYFRLLVRDKFAPPADDKDRKPHLWTTNRPEVIEFLNRFQNKNVNK